MKEPGGVEVVAVEPDSFADDVGLQQGDILLSINRKDVASVVDVTGLQANLKTGDAVQFRVLRKGGRNGEWTSLFVAGMLPANQQ